MSTFQWDKPYAKILCGSKVMTKTMSKGYFSALFSKWFEHFWVMKSYLRGGRIVKDTDGCLGPKKFMKSYLQGGWIIKDNDRCLGPQKKLWTPTYKVDGSLRTPRGALVPKKFMKFYFEGGWIIKDSDGCLGLKKIYEVLLTRWMNHQGHRRVPWSQKNLWIPTYGVDKSSRTPTSALVPKNY